MLSAHRVISVVVGIEIFQQNYTACILVTEKCDSVIRLFLKVAERVLERHYSTKAHYNDSSNYKDDDFVLSKEILCYRECKNSDDREYRIHQSGAQSGKETCQVSL